MRRCLALRLGEHHPIVEAAVLVGLVGAGLRLGRFSMLRAILAFCARARLIRAMPAGTVGAVAGAVTAVARRLPGCNTCLVKALATDVMLRRRGLSSTLHLGVRPPGLGTLDAHAWIDSDGAVVMGALEDLGSYTVLSGARLP